MLRSRKSALLAVIVLSLGLTACGEKSEPSSTATGEGSTTSQSKSSSSPKGKKLAAIVGNVKTEPLSLTLDFYPNPDHAGIYMAKKLGYFAEAGLDVSINTPSDPAAPIKQAAAGRTDLAISYEPEIIPGIEHGLDVVPVAALVNRPLTSLIWLKKSGIKSVADLRGKTIATAGIPYQDAFLKTILARAGLSLSDVKTVNVGYGLLPALVGGRADAMLGGFSNVEGVDLRLRGLGPVVTPVDRLGVPKYNELVLTGSREWLESHRRRVELFIAALERGTAAAEEDPEAATKALLAANSDLDPKLTKAEVSATLPLLEPAPGETDLSGEPAPFGYISTPKWSRFMEWMLKNELIPDLLPSSLLYADDYLPGKGLAQ
jgi:putative hydroxymethylpyrimidine transport system substrate-binding protein